MYVLFDDAGKFLAGRILSQTDASAQVELDSGKRVKVKAASLLLPFDSPAPVQLLEQARTLAAAIEPDMAWEFAPEGEFGFADLAREYFSHNATTTEQAAMLLALSAVPHYFRRAGKGHFKKAPADIVQQALAAIEKKKLQQQQIDDWAQELAEGRCPPAIAQQLYRILFRPDKNAAEYKAVVQASRNTHTAPLDLLRRCGAIASPWQFHWQRFLFEYFPRGTGFATETIPAITQELPLASVQAWSVDDSNTTEIDDALSLQGLGSGRVTLGIHIAAPGLALLPGSALDVDVARQRLSTVYMPGLKLTMLPDAVVQAFTLEQGRDCPAVSLYVTWDENTLEPLESITRLERVRIAANLRHDQLDHIITRQWLEDAATPTAAGVPAGLDDIRPSLAFLWRLTQQLKARREAVRGKPENFSRPDYNFRLLHDENAPIHGDEPVQITMRQRGEPLDLIVAETMIVANSTWGQWLKNLGVPAIYRSQHSLAPGVKVRMGAKALPHAGMGVPCYAWSTSPLRRYVDLLNQWQIIACARHGATAALAAPFKPGDASLFGIISGFEAAYSGYNAAQASMERFWTLQYLRQNDITTLDAVIIRDARASGDGPILARADNLPLVLAVTNGQSLPRGSHVRLRIDSMDDITLDMAATFTGHLEAVATDAGDGSGDDDDGATADIGTIAVALDVTDGDDSAATVPDNPSP